MLWNHLDGAGSEVDAPYHRRQGVGRCAHCTVCYETIAEVAERPGAEEVLDSHAALQ